MRPLHADSVVVKFILQRECHFGQIFCVCGGHPALGDWELGKALRAEWSEGHVWIATAVSELHALSIESKEAV